MLDNINKLIFIASNQLCYEAPQIKEELLSLAGSLGHELIGMLRLKNGFFAFESALHVFPAGCREGVMDLEKWNDEELWRKEYGDSTSEYIFFAEDVFGCQYAIGRGSVFKFDPETAEIEQCAANLEEWASTILQDYNYETGYSLAHEWQRQNGFLPIDQRLLPKKLFVLGGEYEVSNLYAIEAVKGMLFRADIYRQIRELPDGSKIRLNLTTGQKLDNLPPSNEIEVL